MSKDSSCVLYVGADLSDLFAMYGCDRDGIMLVYAGQRFIRWEDIINNRRAANETDSKTHTSARRHRVSL